MTENIYQASERIARLFHESYEYLAPLHNYETRKESAKPWADVPEKNKSLMRAVVQRLILGGHIIVPYQASCYGELNYGEMPENRGWSP